MLPANRDSLALKINKLKVIIVINNNVILMITLFYFICIFYDFFHFENILDIINNIYDSLNSLIELYITLLIGTDILYFFAI